MRRLPGAHRQQGARPGPLFPTHQAVAHYYMDKLRPRKRKQLAQDCTASQWWKLDSDQALPAPKPAMSPARWHLGGTHLHSHPHRPQAGKHRPRTPHPLLLLLHPAILLVGVQLPRKPQVLERVHEGAVQHLLQHVAAGCQQALQRGPHRQAPLRTCTRETAEPTPLRLPRLAAWGQDSRTRQPTPLRPQTGRRMRPRTSSGLAQGHMAPMTGPQPFREEMVPSERTSESRGTQHALFQTSTAAQSRREWPSASRGTF